jgi:hypothetical protein
MVLGYDKRGHCPMLRDHGCSIYEHRPLTCRTYDCRIFPAAGLRIAETHLAPVDSQARRWRFSHPSVIDRMEHDAVRAAAAFLQGDPTSKRDSTTQVAIRAIETYQDHVRPAAGRSRAEDSA